jgi:hypothetical protein
MEGLLPAEKPFTRIKQGGSGTVVMQFATPKGAAFDISAATEIKVELPSIIPGTPLVYLKSLTQVTFVGTGEGGRASFAYSASDTANLVASDSGNPIFQDFQATLTIAGVPIVVQFLGQLVVDKNQF